MRLIEEFEQCKTYTEQEAIMRKHTFMDLVELHEKYPYIKIDDLMDIFYAGMNRTMKEITGEDD